MIANTYLVRLAARGDGKIYGVKAGAGHPTVQEVYYLDAAGVEHVLLDVGGAATAACRSTRTTRCAR